MEKEDTIAAITTAPGVGGIAVLRLSGSRAIEITDKLFVGKTKLSQIESHKACFGRLITSPESDAPKDNRTKPSFLDEVIVTVFRAPRSYTKEDVVEISCHGGIYLSRKILEQLIARGARLAEPGEFSKRAFLHGRFDLSQAEAVADIVHAKTEANLQAALSQYRGVFSKQIRRLREKLIDVCSLLELELDFAEEDVAFAEKKEVAQRLQTSIEKVDALLSTFDRGKILREGAKLVLVGKPNVGKSSLLNALLKEERAIVTDLPGTTRDTLEEQLDIQGVFFRVVDTAGVCETENRIEKEGVNRTLTQIRQADVILFLFDGSQRIEQQDTDLIEQVFSLRKSRNQGSLLAVINKIDLKSQMSLGELRKKIGATPTVKVSAKEHLGLRELEEALVCAVLGGKNISADVPTVTNLRQKSALEKARSALKTAYASLQSGMSAEFVTVDLRLSMDCLAEVIGEVTTEDILGNIFSKFCIGK
ncbi:MAG: tRNA uridine-5-carboxymethylaminomethyl(34) synthesis GTPase MnmE [bacterium]